MKALNFSSILFKWIVILIPLIVLLSCNRDDEPNSLDDSQINQGENNSGENESGKDTQYYFRVETQVGNIRPDAGRMDISFETNQAWAVTYSGNINGFTLSPTKGNGRGHVTISYDEGKYTETSSEIRWNESETITFHIKEGSFRNHKSTTYNVYVSRSGSKIKV